jgi:WD40 repeat protein
MYSGNRQYRAGWQLPKAIVALILLLAACSVAPATPTTTPEPRSTSLKETPLATQIHTATAILPTNTRAVAEASPTPLPRLEGGSMIALNSIHMIDPNVGWGIEASGHIIRTRDGGNTWQDVNPPQGLYNDNGFFALDADMAWSTPRPSDACEDSRMTWDEYQECMPGPEVAIWRTVDGGQTWQANEPYVAEDLHYKPIAIQFIDASTGWFLYVSSFGPMGSTTMGMAKTEDGGISWVHTAAPPSICGHRAVVFLNAQDGWSGADCRFTPTLGTPLQDFLRGKSAPELYRTANGSELWDYTPVPAPQVFPPELTSPRADPNISMLCGTTSMQWISPEAFTLQWTCSSEMGTPYFKEFSYQYITSDGGRSWYSWLGSGNEFFLNAQTGWRLYSPGEGQVGQLQQTTRASQDWKPIKTVAWQTAQFDFVSERVGWAIVTSGDATSLLHTMDGGQTWSELRPRMVIAISPENATQITKLSVWPSDLLNILAFSSDWTTIISLAEDYSGLRLWHMDNRKPYLFIPFQSGDCGLRSTDKVIFSPDGKLFAAGLCNAKVYLWRVADGMLLQKLDGELPDSAAFSPDGSTLATISEQAVTLWKVPSGTWLQRFPGEIVDSVAFSPDGTTVAFASANGLQLWRVADGTLLQTLTASSMSFGDVAFSPDGTLLACAAEIPGLQLWRVKDGTLLATLDPSAYVLDFRKAVFSPDGQLLVSARYGDDGAIVNLWHIPSGNLLQTLTSSNRPISFSPDGSKLALGSANVLHIWGIPTEH